MLASVRERRIKSHREIDVDELGERLDAVNVVVADGSH
jgi:hypothetical protein